MLLRHAKSSCHNTELAYHDRPLNGRGDHYAPRMGQLWAQHDLTPVLIVTSAPRRASTTTELVALAAEYSGDIRYTDELYLADPETFLDVAVDTPDNVARLLLVGHNPGIEELVSTLAGREERMPTAALACFRLAVESWKDVNEETAAELLHLWRPKEL